MIKHELIIFGKLTSLSIENGESGNCGETQFPSSLSDNFRLPVLPGLGMLGLVGTCCCCRMVFR